MVVWGGGNYRFNESIKTFFASAAAESGRKRKFTKHEADLPTSWKTVTYRDLVDVICQSFMSSSDEVLDLTFDFAGSDVNGLDEDEDDEIVSDPPRSLVYRISAGRCFESPAHDIRMDAWDVSPEQRDILTYVSDPEDGPPQFMIPEERAEYFQRLSGRGAFTWLEDVDNLRTFCLPHVQPSVQEKRDAVAMSMSLGGMSMPEDMSDESVAEYLRSTHQGAYMNTPIQRSDVASAVSGNSWSDSVVRTALPMQHEIQMNSRKLIEDVETACREGKLTIEDAMFTDKHLLSLAKSLVVPGTIMGGFPSGPQRVTEHYKRDAATFHGILNGRDKKQSEILQSFYFPQMAEECKGIMSWQTYWYRTQAEFYYYDGALSAQQTRINLAVYAIGFGVDYPGFGYPCHIMATGPPAVGKSWAMKAAQENLNSGKYYACNSESKYAATFKNFTEQVLFMVDEDETAKAQSGTTGQLQSILVDGVITRVRADVDKNMAVTTTVPNRRYELKAGNDNFVNAALSSRYIHVHQTTANDDGQASAFRNRSASHPLGCLAQKVLSGRTVAPWMFLMLGLIPEPDTRPYEVYCAIHSAVFSDSILRHNPRVKQMVLTMSLFTSLMHMISFYERRTPTKQLKDLFTVDFLNFLRCNWVVDPYSIIFSANIQLCGMDPNAEFKCLSLLKNHIKRDPQDRIVMSSCCNYWMTSLAVGDKVLQDLTNEIGIGYAIFEKVVSKLMVKTAAQHPAIIVEATGYKKDFYCIHPKHCNTIRTLSGVEKAIVEHLYSQKSKALVSSDQESLVFPQNVKNTVIKEHLRPQSLKDLSESQIDAAISSLERCGIRFYADNPTLKLQLDAQVLVLQPHNTPGSENAVPGTLLDPDFTGDKWYKPGMVMPNVVKWAGAGIQEYEAILNGRDPLIIDQQNKEKKVIDNFLHCTTEPRDYSKSEAEEVFLGMHDNGDVIMHECQPCTEPLLIVNPDYKPSSSRRLSTGGPAVASKCFFRTDRQKVDITEYQHLMKQAMMERADETMMYGKDTVERVYRDEGSLF